ncbi:type III secretion inner membrane protein SctR [Candidatus Protochlamydia naegleriophila]|uniref:Type III secretion inner membrane protein SctR n=1 Tax=Candidatus Protochlamydia naegleriophila TaxID=389348 RepID=A0A0U5EPM5_9BACT|nr:type III secretion system export apparatus subunit SctR [Candidatus Protochlamydia naegleriophila]CUI15841.1 type III secretion inner membrane protein SctR [Candidatus Protochlamydia naegleriophila]
MRKSRWVSFKSLLCLLGILILLGLAPENLYSQTDATQPPAANSTPAAPGAATPQTPATEAAPGRAATSVRETPRPLRATPRPQYRPPRPTTPTPEEQAYQATEAQISELKRPSLITQAVLLTLLSLMPFIIMILTSFLKIVVVLSLLRTALGVQQAPPNQIINGVAFLLSLFIMYPTAVKMYEAAQGTINQKNVPESFLSPGSSTYVIEVAAAASAPMKDYLKRNSSSRHQALFYRLVYRGLPDDYRETLKPDDFIVLVPSYITGQLKDAFEIGVLIYIPFFVIDLVTSNILLAMGMMMLSPVTISMPLKLFLLVMLDGWTILIEGLVKTFQ